MGTEDVGWTAGPEDTETLLVGVGFHRRNIPETSGPGREETKWDGTEAEVGRPGHISCGAGVFHAHQHGSSSPAANGGRTAVKPTLQMRKLRPREPKDASKVTPR